MLLQKHRRARRARSVSAAVLATVAALAVASCGDDSETATQGDGGEKQVNVAAFMIANNTYSQVLLEGIQEAAKKKGAKVTVFDSQFDAERLFKQVQDATATGRYDAFVIHVIDSNSIVPAVKDAIAQGVQVASTNGVIGPKLDTLEPQVEGLAGQVFTPATVRAQKLSDAVLTACEGLPTCNAAFLAGDLSTSFDQLQLKAIKELPKTHPNLKVIAAVDGKYDPEVALKATQDLITRTKDVQVIATGGDQMAPGIERAVNEAGLKDKVRIVSIGTSESGLQAVREGRWFSTITHVPFDEGRLAAELAIDAALGKPHDVRGIDPIVETKVPPNMSQSNREEWESFEAQWAG
jgi:ribose transport system substrate-binding protein